MTAVSRTPVSKKADLKNKETYSLQD